MVEFSIEVVGAFLRPGLGILRFHALEALSDPLGFKLRGRRDRGPPGLNTKTASRHRGAGLLGTTSDRLPICNWIAWVQVAEGHPRPSSEVRPRPSARRSGPHRRRPPALRDPARRRRRRRRAPGGRGRGDRHGAAALGRGAGVRARHVRIAAVRLRLQRRRPPPPARRRLRAGAAPTSACARTSPTVPGPRLRRRCAPFEPRPTRRPCTRLIEEAFAEIEGHERRWRWRTWRAKGTAKAGHDPSLWLLARGRAAAWRARRSASAGRAAPATSPSWGWRRGRADAGYGRSAPAGRVRRVPRVPGSRTPS